MMPKGKMRPEIFLLLHVGYKPKEIIAKGFSKQTVYQYNKKYKLALVGFQKIIKGG